MHNISKECAGRHAEIMGEDDKRSEKVKVEEGKGFTTAKVADDSRSGNAKGKTGKKLAKAKRKDDKELTKATGELAKAIRLSICRGMHLILLLQLV